MDYEEISSEQSETIVQTRTDREVPTSILLRCMAYLEKKEDIHLLLDEIYSRCKSDPTLMDELVDYISEVEINN